MKTLAYLMVASLLAQVALFVYLVISSVLWERRMKAETVTRVETNDEIERLLEME